MSGLYWDKYVGRDVSYSTIGTTNPQTDTSNDNTGRSLSTAGKGEKVAQRLITRKIAKYDMNED